MKFLHAEGIDIKTQNETIRIYFEAVLILGDNLGIHSLLGFSEAFNLQHPCRFCLTPIGQFGQYFKEDPSLLRSKSNYADDVETLSDGPSHNIVENCIFYK